MWPLDRPAHTAEDTLERSIRKVRNRALKTRLWLTRFTVNTAETEYINAGNHAELHTVLERTDVDGTVTNKEMVAVYTRMVDSSTFGRVIYDDIYSIAVNGRCPFCGHSPVKTLDHFLPKSIYSALVVTPTNLVPSCGACNKLKDTKAPASPQDVILHPYFDNIEDERWLYAEVVEAKPATLRFFVVPSATLAADKILSARVHTHFDTLELDALYRSISSEELSGLRFALSKILDAGSPNDVRTHLKSVAESWRAARVNSWQTAMYEALSDNVWYYSGGFRP